MPRRRPSRLRRPVAALAAAALLVAACTTREQRIGADDGSDVCRPQLVALDSTGDFFGEDILRGAAIGAAGGAVLGGLLGAVRGGRGRDIAAGAAIGGLAGGAVGAAGGYLRARQQQARDQASLVAGIAGDLERENAELDRTQLAFDRLMDCRFQQAQRVREAHRQGLLPRPAAEAQMATLRAWTRRDIGLARTIDQRIGTRGAEFDTAVESVAPGTKAMAETAKISARPVVTARAGAPVPLRLRPDPAAPEIGRVATRDPVQLRPARSGFVLVEADGGQRGYAPAEAFGTRGAVAGDAAAEVAVPAGQPGDVRSLAASNIARRDNFTESVGDAEAAVRGGGFELAS